MGAGGHRIGLSAREKWEGGHTVGRRKGGRGWRVRKAKRGGRKGETGRGCLTYNSSVSLAWPVTATAI